MAQPSAMSGACLRVDWSGDAKDTAVERTGTYSQRVLTIRTHATGG